MKKIHLVEKENDGDPLKNSVVDDRVEDCPEVKLCVNCWKLHVSTGL